MVENTLQQHISRFIDAMDAKSAEWPVLSQIKDVISGCGGEIRAIYQFIDNSLERNDAPIVAYEHGPGLIETDTNYAGELSLNGVNADFRSIRELAKGYASGKQLRQRGTEIIDNHEDLAEYMAICILLKYVLLLKVRFPLSWKKPILLTGDAVNPYPPWQLLKKSEPAM